MRNFLPGDIVTGNFSGADVSKTRPAVVISSDLYHQHRPDILICFLTTQVSGLTSPTDYMLAHWKEAGLHQPSAFRAFILTVKKTEVSRVGRLSESDWREIQDRLRLALAI